MAFDRRRVEIWNLNLKMLCTFHEQIDEVAATIRDLCEETKSWNEIKTIYPIFERQDI